jgi:hypothetical protein
MPELVHEFSYHADLQGSVVGAGPYGQRVFADVVSGTVEGDRLKGTLAATGGDWLIGPDGLGRADVRIQIHTHDGAVIYAQYFGLLEITPGIGAVLGGGGEPTAFEDQYFRTAPGWRRATSATPGSTRPCSWPRAVSALSPPASASTTTCTG